MWVGLLLGLLVATVVGLLLAAVAQRRGKDSQFGYEVGMFSPSLAAESHRQALMSGKINLFIAVFRPGFKNPGPESLVSFTSARSFSRNNTDLQESTCE